MKNFGSAQVSGAMVVNGAMGLEVFNHLHAKKGFLILLTSLEIGWHMMCSEQGNCEKANANQFQVMLTV